MHFGFALPGRGPLATADSITKLAQKADGADRGQEVRRRPEQRAVAFVDGGEHRRDGQAADALAELEHPPALCSNLLFSARALERRAGTRILGLGA